MLQLPGWILILLILFWIKSLVVVPTWALWMIGIAWVVKDIALFPLTWRSYAGDGSEGIRDPVGCIGVCSNRLAPRGSVHILGETWQAIHEEEGEPIEVGSAVRVTERNGLVLRVRAESGVSSEGGRGGGVG
jgi:membrane protein implicated in regulation of membrane protease activity